MKRGRLLGRRRGAAPGPTLVVVAGLHGNEPAGVAAAERVLGALRETDVRGEVVALAGNLGALAAGVRQHERDLNRGWSAASLDALRAGRPLAGDAESAEAADLHAAIESARAAARGPVFLLDLHTTSGDGPPFAIVPRGSASRAFAASCPLPRIEGLLERLDGTLVGALDAEGVAGYVVEAGRHDAVRSVDVAEAALVVALAAAGIATGSARAAAAASLLAEARGALPPEVVVFHRHALAPGDGFRMRPGFRHFQRVAQGEALADDARGPVAAPRAGYVLLPLYQGTGEDGFFLGR